MAYVLTPPTVAEAAERTHPLFRRVRIPRGVSLLVTGSTVVEQRWPTIDQQRAADVTYLGGHVYVLSDARAQVLIDAGYGDCLTRTDVYVTDYEQRY